MSTRSRKRIHNPSNEDIVQPETELVLKSERKTRSKRVVENGESREIVPKSKRRHNYVSYPSSVEDATDAEAVDVETLTKPSRVLRRTTLRDQNAVAEDIEATLEKQARRTRRTKKLSETAPEEKPESPSHQEKLEVVTISNGKPKGKKSKKKAIKVAELEVIDKENSTRGYKKKKNKRKNNLRSDSFGQVESTNDSNMSTDSFHSAAGSPINVNGDSTSPKDGVEFGTLTVEDTTYQGKNKRKSSLKNKSYDINSQTNIAVDVTLAVNTTFDKESSVSAEKESRRKSSIKNSTFDKDNYDVPLEKMNTTFEMETEKKTSSKRKRKSQCMDSIIENTGSPLVTVSSDQLAVKKISNGILNTTFEKDDIGDESDHEKGKKANAKEQINGLLSINASHQRSSVIDKSKSVSPRISMHKSQIKALNGTFEISPHLDQTKQNTFDKQSKLDTTFDKENKHGSTFDKENKHDSTFDKIDSQKPASQKSSLISSDASSINVTLDKSEEISRISITDDDSKTENILNATPLLIESSMEESKVLDNLSQENESLRSQPVTTPLKREGTFTKEEPEAVMSPKLTPNKRQTLPLAGCTPYHLNNKGSKKKSVLNLTHSIEKPGRGSAEPPPRATRVMFCSPVNNPVVVAQQKTKVIKSNLKGSNKSFVYEESEPSPARAGRKRSLSLAPAPAAAKRSRLAALAPPPRARTASATAKLATPGSPAAAPRSDGKPTRLPNFAALHARRFERMESLDECQRRRARRALLLLQPTGSVDVLARSPRGTPAKSEPPAQPPPGAPRGYTRFGFKMDCGVNPFSAPAKPTEAKPKSAQKQKAQPSLAGATSQRRAAARQAVLRAAPAGRDGARQQTRTLIKGVRTNRRFELQMKARNING